MKAKWILPLMMLSVVAVAAPKKKHTPTKEEVCQKLRDDADEECVSLMCDDDIANGTYKNRHECTTASDYGEAAQEKCDGIFPKVVKAYNEKHDTSYFCKPE